MGPSEKKLKKKIMDLLKDNKEKVFELLEEQGKPETLLQIKGIDDLPGIIKKIFKIFTFRKIVDEVIKFRFNFGWEKSEKQIDQNVPMNNKAVEFLQEHTFDNVKGMTEEIANDLKAELSRGIINGEGVTKLKERVTKVFDVGEVRATAIARTEVARSENQGKLLAMKESDIDVKKYLVITYDDRTSNVSKAMGRKYGTPEQAIDLDKNFSVNVSGKEYSGSAPPFMPNDRDIILFKLPE